jgi:hypothetical protein
MGGKRAKKGRDALQAALHVMRLQQTDGRGHTVVSSVLGIAIY